MARYKKWRVHALIAVFILTLFALGKFSLAERLEDTARPPDAGGAYRTAFTLDLGDVEAGDYRRMGGIRAFLGFAPDGNMLAVGTERGELIAIRRDNPKIIWQEKIGIGKITAVEFSPDGRFLYVGESSPDGNLICLDAKTGKKIWQFSTATAVGANLKQKSLPSVVKIAALSGKVYFLALRYELSGDNKTTQYFSKIFCLNDAGREEWVFPEHSPVPREGCMDAWVNWFSVDRSGQQLVFGTANSSGDVFKFNKNMYALNAKTGEENWNAEIPPVLTAKRTSLRGNPNISADGTMIAAIAGDGRGFVFDATGRIIWKRAVGEPKNINGVYLNAVGRDAYIVNDYVVFGTMNTSNSANWQMPTPVEHPSGNNIVVFDRSGNFASRWQAGGSVENLAFSYPYAAAAIGRNTKTKDPNVHGLYIYHLEEGQIAGRIITDGPAVAAAISARGKSAAVVESPLKLDDGRIIGRYRLTLAEKIE